MRAKKIIGLLLALCVLLSSAPAVSITSAAGGTADGEVSGTAWDGQASDTSWWNGTDTEFHLITAEQIAGLASLVNGGNKFSGKTIYLDNDIDLGGKEWTPIGKITNIDNNAVVTGTEFAGVFDGQEHKITGLKISIVSGKMGFGLFAYSKGTIKNLGIDETSLIDLSALTADLTAVGSIVGFNYGGIVSNCYTKASITDAGNTLTKDPCIGGVVGMNDYNGIIEYCRNLGSITLTKLKARIGGIVGTSVFTRSGEGKDSYVRYCYNAATITAKDCDNMGGIAGFSRASNITYCYNVGTLTNNTTPAAANTAGIVGVKNSYAGSVLSYCYNAGTINNVKSQSVTGAGGQPTTNCYYLAGSAVEASGATAVNKAELITAVTGFPKSAAGISYVADTAGFNNGFPVFSWQKQESGDVVIPYMDINYVESSNLAAQTLDIQLPLGGSGPYPVVVYIHGGAWVKGDKTSTEVQSSLSAALAQGYAVVCINYRWAQNAQWPAQIYDCKAAVRFLRANAEKYRLDADKIAVLGASAGAHLAQFMGVTNGDEQYEDLSMGNASYSSDVQAVISFYGISDLTAWKEPSWITGITTTGKDARTTLLGDNYTKEAALDASPVSHISKSSVPMLIAHGMNDTTVNADESTVFAEKLTEAIGFKLVDTYFPASAEHADTSFWNSAEPVKAALNFLQKQFSPTKNLNSPENTRPDYSWVDLSAYTRKYMHVSYASTSAAGTQKLHVILPETGTGPYPLIVFIHGGSFRGGNFTGNSSVLYTAEGALQALEKGYAVAMVNYRYAPEAYFPEPIYDVKAAIRFLRSNAATYHLDPYNFAIWGESAGGLIADLVGTTNGDPNYEDLSMGNAYYSSAVQAVVSWYAITDMATENNARYRQNWLGAEAENESVIKDASSINHVTPSAPPFYLQHGMADDAVEYQDSVNLYEKLVKLSGNPNTKLELFPGITHAVKLFLSKPNANQITAWLDTVLVNHAPDTSRLSERLVSARALNLNRYISLGQKEFSEAVVKAQSVLNLTYASEQAVQEADSDLAAAMEYLRLTGDLDEDKNVTVSDVVSLRSVIMTGNSTNIQKSIGDLDSDGTLTVSDVVALRTYIMKGME